ncbi:MAG TPA: ComGF family competence protein [Lentibacillus sp.]|uniref:ComGF family competence protein n=1 Tax=Lentibacillus sp. TaxID=1925746 RepID=UPI002B4AC86E|nr:ComGF family competence protein [Lentibacillus sp.]HLR62413.1 ComGF family competence protein [Lentibacillus sp.]
MREMVNSVYTGIRKNEQGFTFISIFLAVSIIFMTIPFTAYLTKTADYTTNYDRLSVQQFFFFLRDEVIRASDIIVEPTKITLLQPDDSRVLLEQYDDLIIRQLDEEGFEVYLRNVRDVQFAPLSYGLHASITTTNGDQFEKIIVFYN